MSGEKKLREFWIDADLGQVLRVKPFSSDSVRFSHVIEHSAYLAVKQELDAAWERGDALKNVTAGQLKAIYDLQIQIADAKAQIADYEAALAYYDNQCNGGFKDRFPHHTTMHNMARETLNKWKSK